MYALFLPFLWAFVTPTPAPAADVARATLPLVNEIRARGCTCGGKRFGPAPALSWHPNLERAAQTHADYMAAKGKMTHYGNKNGRTPGDRARAAGYIWLTYAENIAYGQRTPQQVVKEWVGSTTHCQNIMNPAHTHYGAGYTGGYWAQVFASPQE